MDEMDALREATKHLTKLDEAMTDARTATYAAVVAALRAGHTPTEVTKASPYTAAYVRKIARLSGIQPAAPGPKKTRVATATLGAITALTRAVAAQDGTWDTGRAVTALRDAGVPVGDGDRAADKQARAALRQLADDGVLVRVDSPGNTVTYRRATEED